MTVACSLFTSQVGSVGIFARISFYRQWIEDQMTAPRFCTSGPDADTVTKKRRRKNKGKGKKKYNRRKHNLPQKNSI